MTPNTDFKDMPEEFIGRPEIQAVEAGFYPVSKEEKKILSSKNSHERKSWMRNKECPCGSGKKFKKCCWGNVGGFK